MNDKPFWVIIGFLTLIGLATFTCPSGTDGYLKEDPHVFGELAWGTDLGERSEFLESGLQNVITPYLPDPLEMMEYSRTSDNPEFLTLSVASVQYYSYNGKFCLVQIFAADLAQFDSLLAMAREKLGSEKRNEKPGQPTVHVWFGNETWISMRWNGRDEPAIEVVDRDALRELKKKMVAGKKRGGNH